MTKMIRVSVVVPTFKRPELLSRCLTALSQQDFDPTAYEVIIVDDAAGIETKRLVENWLSAQILVNVDQEKKYRSVWENSSVTSAPTSLAPSSFPVFRYVPVTGTHGPAAARNVGWRAACGEIIAFTDDDCIPDRNWLKAGVSAFADEVVGVWGRTIVPIPDTPTDYELNAARLGLGEFVTANCFYRRDAIASIGGFDERFTAAWREDSDVFFTLLERGSQFVHAPDAIVVHPIRKAPWAVSLSQQRKAMFNALLYKKHPVLYREKLPPVTPWHYYWIVSAIALALWSVLSQHLYFALAAIGAWSVLTGRFCWQRLHQTSHAPEHIAEMIVTSVLIPPLSLFWRLLGALKFRVFFL
ncbi:MAG TPA: glycosyltransferase [Chroococcales cyanobacterium]|jgi:GT2 family glycosyltransferase